MKKEITVLIVLTIILIIMVFGFFLYYQFGRQPDIVEVPKTEEEKLVEQGIKVVSKETFIQEANTLLEKGYSADEINQIYDYMSDNNLKHILEHEYVDLSSYFQISNFDFTKLERYRAYQSAQGIEMKDVVTRVNLNLDEPFYQTIETITNPSSVTALVNKSHTLPSDYVPDDLVSIPSFPHLKLRQVAVDDFEKLLSAATLDGVYMNPYSTYRSYDYQKGLYEKYASKDPLGVDTYSARPGHSEHQTGLAIDIRSNGYTDNLSDADYEWMKNHSYQYGFIIRYPKGNSAITGYQEEPWHIRYVGIEVATKLHKENITFDEYYDLYFESY